MESEALKPCPLCGGEAAKTSRHSPLTWCVNQHCQLRGIGITTEAWNSRPSDPVIEANAQRLRELKPGWDNEHAPVISEAAINMAVRVLGQRGQLTPCSNGGVQIDWSDAEICFMPDGVQEFDAPNRETRAVIAAAQKVADWWRVQWNEKSATLFGFQQHIGDTEVFRIFNALALLLPAKEGKDA